MGHLVDIFCVLLKHVEGGGERADLAVRAVDVGVRDLESLE